MIPEVFTLFCSKASLNASLIFQYFRSFSVATKIMPQLVKQRSSRAGNSRLKNLTFAVALITGFFSLLTIQLKRCSASVKSSHFQSPQSTFSHRTAAPISDLALNLLCNNFCNVKRHSERVQRCLLLFIVTGASKCSFVEPERSAESSKQTHYI